MLRPSQKLDDLNRQYARERLAKRSYAEALAVFAALWREAAEVNSDFPASRKADLTADLAIARAVNGLPPES